MGTSAIAPTPTAATAATAEEIVEEIEFIPFFNLEFSTNPLTYLILCIVCIIYAVTDRLNIEARYGLEPSTFSMLKQLSTVFMIIFGLICVRIYAALSKYSSKDKGEYFLLLVVKFFSLI